MIQLSAAGTNPRSIGTKKRRTTKIVEPKPAKPKKEKPPRPSRSDRAAAEADAFRRRTASLMQCPECRGPMVIGDTGLTCEAGHGRIEPFGFEMEPLLRKHWPERCLERKPEREPTKRRLAQLRAADPPLPPFAEGPTT